MPPGDGQPDHWRAGGRTPGPAPGPAGRPALDNSGPSPCKPSPARARLRGALSTTATVWRVCELLSKLASQQLTTALTQGWPWAGPSVLSDLGSPMFTTARKGRYRRHHLSDEEVEAQKRPVACPGPPVGEGPLSGQGSLS